MTKNMKAGVSTNSRLDRMSRRRVLEFAFGLAVGTSGGARLVMAQSPPPCPENIGVHNMMVFGERSVFLSHLPMFRRLVPRQSALRAPNIVFSLSSRLPSSSRELSAT